MALIRPPGQPVVVLTATEGDAGETALASDAPRRVSARNGASLAAVGHWSIAGSVSGMVDATVSAALR
jgi:LmbE family N-acetylglucosaminyl deacetylase